MVTEKGAVLFLCTGNSCRSQMAEGWLGHLAGDRYRAYSAGTRPQPVHPLAKQVMAEAGVDIAEQVEKSVDQLLAQDFDTLITVCDNAKESCPHFSGKVGKRLHWPFSDPAAASGTPREVKAVFCRVRDEIRARVAAHFVAARPQAQKSGK